MIAAEIFNCQTPVSTRGYIFLKKELFELRDHVCKVSALLIGWEFCFYITDAEKINN